jgi:HK97 family phage portal protein
MLAAGMLAKSGNNMGLVTTMRGLWGPIQESFAGAWQRNITVEPPANLATYSPIYACVTRIAGDIAKLGLQLLTETATPGVPELAPKNSPFWRVLRRPNSFQNRIQFIRYWLICKLLFGNAYAMKVRDERGIVVALYLLDPRRVTPLVTPDGGVYYSLSSDQLARIPTGIAAAPASEIIHDRGPTLWHPLIGVPPIYACALSGTLGLRIQQNSTTFFQNMSRPSGMLTAPGTIDDITAARLTKEWNENYSGTRLGRLAVLGDGLKYEALTIAAEQAQLVEQLGLTAIDVATAFGMPAYKINQGSMPTNNNVQALNQQYYSDCLQTHIEDIELCLEEGLSVPDGYRVEFDLDGLLRMDSATQMDVLAKGVGGAILKPDEARAKLNRRPIPGGDAVYLQQQNYSLEALAKRDAMADPFAKPVAPAPAPPAAPAVAADPAAGSKAAEDLLARSLDAISNLASKAAAADEQRLLAQSQAARAQSEADEARALVEQLQEQARAPAAEDIEFKTFVDELLLGLDALEPAHG